MQGAGKDSETISKNSPAPRETQKDREMKVKINLPPRKMWGGEAKIVNNNKNSPWGGGMGGASVGGMAYWRKPVRLHLTWVDAWN